MKEQQLAEKKELQPDFSITAFLLGNQKNYNGFFYFANEKTVVDFDVDFVNNLLDNFSIRGSLDSLSFFYTGYDEDFEDNFENNYPDGLQLKGGYLPELDSNGEKWIIPLELFVTNEQIINEMKGVL